MKINIHFWLYLSQLFLEWEMCRTKFVDKIKTHILCSATFFSFENCAIGEIMWKNIVERDRPQMKIRRMRIAHRIIKATNTLSEYVVLAAFHCKYSCMYAPQLPALLKAIVITSFPLCRNLSVIFPSDFLTNIKFQFLISSMCVFCCWSKSTSFYHPNNLRARSRNYEHVYYTVLSSLQLLPLL